MSDIAIDVLNLEKKFKLNPDTDTTLKSAVVNLFKNKRYDFYALKGVTFNIKKGEMLGIIGSNGAGKTTILKLLSGIIKPTSGVISINGRTSSLLELGAGFHPDLTGTENIYLDGAILRIDRKKIKKMFDDVVDFAEIKEFINIPVKYYSSGMLMRLGFSIAIHVDFDILLVDEVLAVGDESFQKKCFAKISEFRKSGKTIVFVSHFLDAVGQYCDRVLWINEGKIMAEGEPEDVIKKYIYFSGKGSSAYQDIRMHLKQKWGTGEIEIVEVSFYDSTMNKKDVFSTGEDIIVRYKYKVNKRVEKPVFGMAIHRDDGVHMFGTNTLLSGKVPDFLDKGEGEVEYILKNNPLNEGLYLFSADVFDYELKNAYDRHNKTYKIRIDRGKNNKSAGVLNIPCEWKYL